ncbi:Fe(3+)-siderophore ABC transporter permease [Streptomyces sp. V2]|uniref:iron chelate uptake ABC transporter family permease subunit n=1 Tax=Streptomyces TaxID=1883 RepID=UPI0006EBBE15|nr:MULTISPECIES: iron chelate uptake ABC transporter family permease subunit [Streptomyces]PWG12744.1 Fe(3+)-siderophore ABC transporter permease [Streptomyces sp. V2]
METVGARHRQRAADPADPGDPPPAARQDPPRTAAARRRARLLGVPAVLALIVLLAMVSVAVGAKPIPLGTVFDAVLDPHGTTDEQLVRALRLPRTGLGLVAGAALGVAGALMQTLTRNPLADPGILGVNAGASAAVVLAIGFAGLRTFTGYVWFALAGAAVVAALVHVLGAVGPGGATPTRLVLAGTAIAAALTALTSAVLLARPAVFDAFRFWTIGSVAGREASVLYQVTPFLVAGALIAAAVARPLDALAIGDDGATALGARVGLTRTLGVVAVTLLCGAVTAAVGPIGFVGLAVPHLARVISGPDHRWILFYSAGLGALLLLAADVLGRVVASPGELEVGIVTAFLGAPALVVLTRRGRGRRS